jgi:hypothetical protein
MIEFKLQSVDGGVGLVLPKEMLAHLGVCEVDFLVALATKDGYLLRAIEADVAEQVEAGKAIFGEYGATFRKLAEEQNG